MVTLELIFRLTGFAVLVPFEPQTKGADGSSFFFTKKEAARQTKERFQRIGGTKTALGLLS
jgi:hypothetical protein